MNSDWPKSVLADNHMMHQATEDEVRWALESVGWFGYFEVPMSERCKENLKKLNVWINEELVQQGETNDTQRDESES
jgi:hypothetical protein